MDPPQILNPAHTSDLSMSLRQPLLRDAGSEVNLLTLLNAQLIAEKTELDLKNAAMHLMGDTESAHTGTWPMPMK